MNSLKIEILNNLNPKNLSIICDIYSKELNNDVLPNFGKDVLIKYFKLIVKNKNGVILVAIFKNKIVGFLALRFKKINLVNILDLKSIFIFFYNTILNPIIFFKLIFQVFKKDISPNSFSEIHAFAIKNEYKSIGLGKKLIKKAEIVTFKKNMPGIFTKTSNKNLYWFYKKRKKITLIEKFKIIKDTYFNISWKIK